MATHLHRLLLLPLLLFLPSALLSRRGSTPPPPPPIPNPSAAAVYPVVLVPGNTCSQFEARLTDAYSPPPDSPQCGAPERRGRWFRLWRNATGMADPAVAPCLADQLRVVYDPAARDFRDVPGVQTRILGFGSTSHFLADTDANKDLCMGKLIEALEQAGYRDGETLFGAPYDFRQAPAAVGQPCRAFSRFTRQLRGLVERASMANGGRPVVLVSHSQGGYFALAFLNRSPPRWRRRYVRRYVMASMSPAGLLLGMKNLATAPDEAVEAPDALVALPSPAVYGAGTGAPPPLVVTRERNYTASDMSEFLKTIGVPPLGVALYETRALPVELGFRAPAVPTTCVNGAGVPTMKQLVYWDGNFSEAPEVVYGDGDGFLPETSILALDTLIGGDPGQEYYKSIRLADTSHAGVVSDAAAVKRIVDEILGTNPM